MSVSIKKTEDLSLNAWPSHQIEVYDGWILRYSYFYTHRTNCVEQIGPSALPLSEKISYCEEIYRRWRTPCIFKISPITEPSLDRLLEERGYRIEHPVEVMTHSLSAAPAPALPEGVSMHVSDHVDSVWINRLFELKGDVADIHRKIVPGMYAAIPKDEIAVTVLSGNETCGIGLGILDRDCAGVYAIHVSERWRKKGIASAIVCTILDEARKRSAKSAYLQVVEDNYPAKRLYRKLGFIREYRCYFRVHD
ncbi:MAG: GNAT family N-acetyltransferase [Lachnospiraceae bacterium]|nr:GNAT family N-acetyltransferase [Lachnospiraceae bacterium]